MNKKIPKIALLLITTTLLSIFGNRFALGYNDNNKNLEKILSSNGYSISNISDNQKNELLNTIYTNTQKTSLSTDILKKGVKKDKNDFYRLIIKTDLGENEVKNTLNFFDKDLKIKDRGEGFYDLSIPLNSNISNVFFKGFKKGEIPSELLNFDVIEPELIQIDGTGFTLDGEQISNIWGITKIGAEKYQSGLTLPPKFKIGIIDTGIDYNHIDLSQNIYSNSGEIPGDGIDNDNNGYVDDVIGYDFINSDNDPYDDNGHGTHVSGIAGGAVNGGGIFGINSNASLVGLKVLDSGGSGNSYDIGDAITYAADNGIKVINMSLGGRGTPSRSYLCASIDSALSKGTISVVAAGNSNADVSKYVPAGCPNAITVSAVDSNLNKASFSNYGSKVDVAAPGVGIYSSVPGNSYDTWAGTSMATPFITGLVSVMLTYDNLLSNVDIENIFTNINLTDAVNSSSYIGRFPNMGNIMTYLGVSPDNGGSTGGGGNTGINNPPVVDSITYTKSKRNVYTITANASDSDGSVVKYDFYANGTLYQSGGSNIFKVRANSSFTLKVVVWDNDGATGEKTITVN